MNRKSSVLLALLGYEVACHRAAAPEPQAPPAPAYSADTIIPSGKRKTGPLAPGRIASIYGTHLGPAEACQGAPDPSRRETAHPARPHQTPLETSVFPSALCGVQVLFGGVPAGLLYVSASQINFKVPQQIPAGGTAPLRVSVNGQTGPVVQIPMDRKPLPAEPAAVLAERMWTALSSQPDSPSSPPSANCQSTPAPPTERSILLGYSSACRTSRDAVTVDTYIYPSDPVTPTLHALRTDIHPAGSYLELDTELERLLTARLVETDGPGEPAPNLPELGILPRGKTLAWRHGNWLVILHRNRYFAAPFGNQQSVVLIRVDRALVELHLRRAAAPGPGPASAETQQALAGILPAFRPPPPLRYPMAESDRARLSRETRASLDTCLRLATTSTTPNQQAAALYAADGLATRLGSLLVERSIEKGSERLTLAPESDRTRRELAAQGIVYSGIGHYSGDLEYDHALLEQASTRYGATEWGQRAWLELSRQACTTPRAHCDGPNCFLTVIGQGNRMLAEFPTTPLRRQILYALAQAQETAWSLSLSLPGDISATGSRMTPATGEQARLQVISFYEALRRDFPGTPEAEEAEWVLPRLKLRLDTGSRTYFCFDC